jgi:hypothetical protein
MVRLQDHAQRILPPVHAWSGIEGDEVALPTTARCSLQVECLLGKLERRRLVAFEIAKGLQLAQDALLNAAAQSYAVAHPAPVGHEVGALCA